MSVSTHLEILTTLEAWAQSQEDIPALLVKTLPFLRQTLANAEHLTLFRLEGHTLSVMAATQPDTAETPKVNPTYSQALTLRKPTFDEGRAAWVIPMSLGTQPYGLLQMTCTPPHPPLDESAQQELVFVGAVLAQALESRYLRTVDSQRPRENPEDFVALIAARQHAASAEISAAATLPSMATALKRHLLPDALRFLSLYELDIDADGNAKSWRVTYADHPYPADQLAWNDLGEVVRSRLLNGELVAPAALNTLPLPQLGDRFYRWLMTQNMKSFAFAPLMSAGRTTALLLVFGKEQALLKAEELAALENLSDQMGTLYQVRRVIEQAREMRTIVDNLALANRLMAIATDYPSMAEAIMYTLARGLRGASITLFDRPLDEQQTPKFRRIVGLAIEESAVTVDASLERGDTLDSDQLMRLHNGQPVFVEVLEHSGLSVETKSDYAAVGAKWMASYGIRAGGQLIGTLDLLNDNAHPFTQDEIDAYATLADQIGLNVRTRQLHEETRLAQAMAAQLVHTNSRIAVAEDYPEMALTMMETMPSNIEAVAFLLFDEPITAREMPRYIRAEALATRDGVTEPNVSDSTPNDNLIAVRTIKTLIDGQLLIVENTAAIENNPIPNVSQMFAEQGLHSFAAVALRTGSRLLGALCLLAKDAVALRRIQADTLQAIAGQVSIAIENRNLLNQTADALSFVAAQYEMSNALFRAQDNREMLGIMYRFADGVFDSGALGIIDHESQRVCIVAKIEDGEPVGDERGDQTLYEYPLPQGFDGSESISISEDRRTLSFPLINRSGEAVALLTFSDSKPIDMPFNQLRALRSLADQLAVIIENRTLLMQTDRALIETRVLYEMNQSLLATQDSLDILGVVRRTIAQSAHSLALIDIQYNTLQDTMDDFVLEALLTPEKAERQQLSLYRDEDIALFESFLNRWDKLGAQVSFVENIDATLPEPVVHYLHRIGIELKSAVFLPVQDENRIKHQLMVGFTSPMRFSERDRRLYSALRDQVRILLENQRLLRDASAAAAQLGSQVRVLQAINQLAASITSAQTEHELMREGAQALYTALRCDHVGITLLNPDNVSATVVGEYPEVGTLGVIIDGENEFQQMIMRNRMPIYVADVSKDHRLAAASREVMLANGIRSTTLYPLIDAQGRYFGSVGIDSNKVGFELNLQMLDVTRTITTQMIITLQNIRQLRNTQRQAEQLQALAVLNQQIQTQLEQDLILQSGLEALPNILSVDTIALYQMDIEQQKPYLFMTYQEGKLQSLPIPKTLITPDEHSALAAVLRSRDMITIANASQAELVPSFDVTQRSVLTVPLFARGVIVAVIEVGNHQPYAFADTDAVVFRQFATQLSIALENAQAYTQSQRIAKSKALVNEISSKMQQQQEFEDVLNVTIEELGRALGARKGRIRLGNTDNK